MPTTYIFFSGVNDSAQITVTKLLANRDHPSARMQPKPSNIHNLNAKNQTEKHVSHSNFCRLPLAFLASLYEFLRYSSLARLLLSACSSF